MNPRRPLALVLVLASLCATACGPKRLRASSVVRLELVDGLGASSSSYCAGSPVPVALFARADLADGSMRASVGPKRFPVSDLVVHVDHGKWIEDHGELSLFPSPDLRDLLGGDVTITASLAKRSDMAATFTLRPRFDCRAVLDVAGASGRPGRTPPAGATFRSGGPVSGFSQINQMPGRDGLGGGDGESGGSGASASAVTVKVALVDTPRGKLAVVSGTTGAGVDKIVAFDPDAGDVIIDANGGDGAAGGRGGAGGQGAGGSKPEVPFCAAGDGGNGGDGGHGGNGGNGGDGGTVTIVLDLSAAALHDHIHVTSRGGVAGAAGFGGDAGAGGAGGPAIATVNCPTVSAGNAGHPGQPGAAGLPGTPGKAGPPPTWSIVDGVAAEISAQLAPPAK